ETRPLAKANLPVSSQDPHDSFIPTGDARYEYLGEVAAGGMGRIVAVRDRALRRKVAMKVLVSPDSKASPRQMDQLLAEAQTTGQLEHPNIVPIHEFGTTRQDKCYFTMKFVKGDTLQHIFRKLKTRDTRTD